MGFWSKLGKIGLKVAPYAAMAIPGVGIPLGMAIAGATSAASKKLEGGSLKDALISGGIGAGTAAIPGVGGAASKVAGKAASKGATGFLKTTGKNLLTGGAGKITAGTVARNAPALMGLASTAMSPSGGEEEMPPQRRGIGPSNVAVPQFGGQQRGMGGGGFNPGNIFAQNMSRQLGPVMGQMDQSNPNLAAALGAGRMEAMQNQPFRGGYNISSYGPTEEQLKGLGPRIDTMMPMIGQPGGYAQGMGTINRNRRPAL